MKFESHYSSSKANLYVVTAANGSRLLIECGCTPKKLLKAVNYKLNNIEFCLLSHEHQDHAKSVEYILESGIDVLMSRGTAKALELEHRRLFPLGNGHLVKLNGAVEVFPFNVQHDCEEPLGFVIKADGESLLFITDTFMVRQRFGLAFNIIAICCNYDGDWLQKRVEEGLINETYAKRLLTSHMEKNVTKSYIRDCCCLDKCTEIHLLHMSGTNIDKEKIRAEFEKEFFIKTYIAGN